MKKGIFEITCKMQSCYQLLYKQLALRKNQKIKKIKSQFCIFLNPTIFSLS